MPKIITSKSGKALRDAVNELKRDNRQAFFPESGLDVNEQAAFLKDHGHEFDEIYTLSPFIISDAKDLVVLDDPYSQIKFGDSINKVTMSLWRRETIGCLADNKISEIRSLPEKPGVDLIEEAINSAYNELGDSVEKTFLISFLYKKKDEAEGFVQQSPSRKP